MTSDWELDRMYEKETDRILAKQEEHDRKWDKAIDSVGYINVAIEHMKKVIDAMISAQHEVDGIHSCEDRIVSMVNDMEDLLCDIEALRRKFIKGDIL